MANGLYIKKYSGTNYFYDRVFIDSIKLDSIPTDGIPLFMWDTEDIWSNEKVLGSVYCGDFRLKLSFVQNVVSQSGKSLHDFIFRNDDLEDYFFLVILISGNYEFSGTARPENISANFNYNDNDSYYMDIWCFGLSAEFARRVGRAPLSTLDFPNGQIKTFEQYIPFHFGGLTSNTVLINLPSQSYKNRLANYGNPAGVWAYGDFFNFINDKSSISRWEAFRELARGLGFSYEMYLNPGSEVTSEPEFIFNIFFLKDLEGTEPIRIEQVIKHNQELTHLYAKWLFLKYRSLSRDGVDYSSGIFISKNGRFDSDADQNHNQLYPACLIYMNGKLLSYDEGTGGLINLYKDVEFKEYELKQYPYSFGSGGGQGKLYPLNEGYSGGMAYAKIFNAATGSGTNIDRYDNKPIQRYAIENYKRFLRSYAKQKILELPLDQTGITKPWQNVVLNDGGGDEHYYISSIRDLNLFKRTMKVTLIKYY